MPKDKVERPPAGVEFPEDAEGKRSTMGVNKNAFAKAMGAADAKKAADIDNLEERKWRRAYQKNVVEQVRESAKSEKKALDIAQAGLDYLHTTMRFVRDGEPEVSLQEAMNKHTAKKFQTYEVQGKGEKVNKYTVQYKPYGKPGRLEELSGNALHKQIDTWVRNGTIEMSCGHAMSQVIDNPEWIDLSDTYFVLFGATSAMGPFYKLMDLGANVIAIDLDRKPIWERLLKDTRSRAGKLIFPVKAKPTSDSDDAIAEVAGCNLLTDTPEIRNWLEEVCPGKRLVCMGLAYLDGALFVKVSMAMDAIIKSLIEKRGAAFITPAYLCTPTDAHLCTSSSVVASKTNMIRTPGWQKLLKPLCDNIGRPMKKNVEQPLLDDAGNPIEGLQVVDCIIPEQGPNYILAKRLQHWRAIVSRNKGCTVSSNVAPSTATASVLSNVLFALGYKGMSSFRPMEITYQETSNAVMASLLIRDIRDPSAAANPKTYLRNPLNLFTDNAWHGGCWRTAWKFSSLGAPALIGYVFFAFINQPYLLGYNLYQTYGWGQALTQVLPHVLSGDRSGLWPLVGAQITFFQHLGMMEVVHAVIGCVPASPALTFLQIFSRFLVCSLLNTTMNSSSPVTQDTTWIPIMLSAWCIADFTRYVFYSVGLLRDIITNAKGLLVAMKIIKAGSVEKADDYVFTHPFPLVWLRYSLFYLLYPSGVLGELMCIWMTRDAAMGIATVADPPNTTSGLLFRLLQFSFGNLGLLSSTTRYMGFMLLCYIGGLPPLFMSLVATRKKVLGAPKAKKSSQKDKQA